MLRLKSLGQTIIEANEALVTPSAETIFATSLYLIMEAGRPIGRDELTQLVWPGVSEAQAQHGLRQVLYKLKSYGATIKADRSSLILSPRFCTTDFAELLEPQPNSVLEALAAKVGGSFLPGYRPELSEQFATWVERQRDMVHSALARTLVAGMQAKKRVSDWGGAEQLASMCLTIDPLNEEATLTVAEAAALGGSKSKALSILNNYLRDIGEDAGEIKLPAALLRRRISEAYQENIFPVRDAPFVGREQEMAELTRALARAQAGHGSAYVITGEPGIGKTRLVQEFTRVAALQRVHIVRVGCQSHDVRRPLSAFVDMVPKLLALPGALGCSPESMGYLKKLTALEKEAPNEEHFASSHEGIFELVRAALLDLVDALTSECCLVIYIEDSQSMDEYSKSLHQSLAEKAGKHRLFLLTSLTAASPEARLYNSPQSRALHLTALSLDASEKLAESTLLSRRNTSIQFREWCVRSGCGNPFFTIELARYAHDDGSFTAPPSLANLINTRLSALSSFSQRVLQASGILGRHSQLATIELVLNERRVTLLESLDELMTGGFIEVDSQSVVSRHALITEAALGRASSASKAILHLHAAHALQAAAQENSTVLWDCAEHWRQAGDFSRAIELMAYCAQHSLKMGLPLEAATMLEAAASLVDDEAQIPLLRECTSAYEIAGAWSDAGRLARKVLDTMKRASATAVDLCEAEYVHLNAITRQNALTPEIVSKLLSFVESTEIRMSLRLRAAVTLLKEADSKQDKALASKAYAAMLHVDLGSAEEISLHDHVSLIYHSSFGNACDALPALLRLIAFARSTVQYDIAAMYFLHAGHSQKVNGDDEAAGSLYREAYETSRTHYLHFKAESAAGALVGLALSTGDLHGARTWSDLAKEASTRSKRGGSYPESMSYEAELCIREGRYEEARALIHSLRDYSTQLGTVRARARQIALEVDLKLSCGGTLNERERREMLSIYSKTTHAFRNDYFVAQLVRGLLSMKQHAQASEMLIHYVSIDRPPSERLSVAILELLRAQQADAWSGK